MPNDSIPSRLLINISNSYNGMSASSGTLHEAQLGLLTNRVREIVGRAQRYGKFLEESEVEHEKFMGFDRSHDVITVHGKRGAGKTTFLLNALAELQKGHTPNNDSYSDDLNELCVLGIMDPTLFGLHEHLLLTLLGKIAQKVRSTHRNRRIALCDANNAHCALEDWENSLAALAKGLKFIGENREELSSPHSNGNVQWEEATFLMERNIDSARHGLELELCFHRFLHKSLKLIGKKAFVLALDDADTRPIICWHVLEVLRRYFTTPQLVVILSGDLDLFQTLIEKKQLDVYGLSFTSPANVLARFQNKVDDLTEQYMLKILRTPSRISLGTFKSALDQWRYIHKDGEIAISNGSGKEIPLDSALENMFHALGCHSAPEQQLIRNTVLANPTRTVVQVLHCLLDKPYPSSLAERLREVSMVSIQRLGFEDPSSLSELLQAPQGITAIMKQLLPRNAVQVGLELLPTRSSPDVNNALLALLATLNSAMNVNTSVLLAYMLKACLLREVLALRGDVVDETAYARIEEFLALEGQELACMTASRIVALHSGDPSSGPLRRYGMIRLYAGSITKNAPIAMNTLYGTMETPDFSDIPEELEDFCEIAAKSGVNPERRLKAWINTPETLRSMLECWQRDLSGLGVVDVRRGGDNFRFFSIFPLLAVMEDVLVDSENAIKNIFSTYAQIPNINCFDAQSALADKGVSADNDGQDLNDLSSLSERETMHLESFQERLRRWSSRYSSGDWGLSPTLCARIMARFFKALARIDDSMKNDQTFVGIYIHRCIVAFFNSVLVEEARLQDEHNAARVSFDAPATSDLVFLQNILATNVIHKGDYEGDVISGSMQKLHSDMLEKPFEVLIQGTEKSVNTFNRHYPLFSMVFSFPLWGLYLQPTEMDGDGKARTVYELYAGMQNLYFGTDEQESFAQPYAQVFYGESLKSLKNLYPVLNSLAKTSGANELSLDREGLESFYSEAQLANRKRAKLLLTPKRFQSKAVLNDLKQNMPDKLAGKSWSPAKKMPADFYSFYKEIVDLYFPRVDYYEDLYTQQQAAGFWKIYCKDLS